MEILITFPPIEFRKNISCGCYNTHVTGNRLVRFGERYIVSLLNLKKNLNLDTQLCLQMGIITQQVFLLSHHVMWDEAGKKMNGALLFTYLKITLKSISFCGNYTYSLIFRIMKRCFKYKSINHKIYIKNT